MARTVYFAAGNLLCTTFQGYASQGQVVLQSYQLAGIHEEDFWDPNTENTQGFVSL
jgi:hypothetical protein